MKKRVFGLIIIALMPLLINLKIYSNETIPGIFARRCNAGILSFALGDAFGRLTEFIPDVDSIYKKYPNYKPFHESPLITYEYE